MTPSAAAATSADRTISSRLAAERAIVEQLAAENGVVFTRSLARMINDVRDSCTLVAEFGLSTRDGDNNQQATSIIADIEDGSWANVSGGGGINEPPVAFAVTVATDTFWPPHLRAAAASCRLPPMIASVCDEFERFYLGRHEGRRLRWCAAASVAVVAARFLGAEAALETTRRVEAVGGEFWRRALHRARAHFRIKSLRSRSPTMRPTARARRSSSTAISSRFSISSTIARLSPFKCVRNRLARAPSFTTARAHL